jgi:predicted SAM-dependent methyltransferase
MKSHLNLGCGKRFHPAWMNIDNNVSSPFVIRQDLLKEMPFPDESFDVVYHSHLLEHFPKPYAVTFLRECHRLLKRRGIIRIVIPNLEQIAKLYLQTLEAIDQGKKEWEFNYEWIYLNFMTRLFGKSQARR